MADAHLVVAEERQNPQPGLVGQRLEQRFELVDRRPCSSSQVVSYIRIDIYITGLYIRQHEYKGARHGLDQGQSFNRSTAKPPDRRGAALKADCGCGTSACCDPITSDLYEESQAAAIPAEALLASLGCGNPTALAELKPGEVVLDLGSGGGIDVLLSARRVGPAARRTGWT